MRLFHFSDDPGIERFLPRAVAVAPTRPPGQEWLNGRLVWAIDELHEPMYLFPRDCPRILIWAEPTTSRADRDCWLGSAAFAVFVEADWLDRLSSAVVHRYELPAETFICLGDAGMWVSASAVSPSSRETVARLPAQLADRGCELRTVRDFGLLDELRASSLHVSAIRLRNARPPLASGRAPAGHR